MFTAIPGYAIYGIRAGYELSDGSSISADFSNIFDKSFRGARWG